VSSLPEQAVAELPLAAGRLHQVVRLWFECGFRDACAWQVLLDDNLTYALAPTGRCSGFAL